MASGAIDNGRALSEAHRRDGSMKRIADFLFEGHMLKYLPRSGYSFLGVGRESVAEHTYMTAFIGWVLSRLEPAVDSGRLVTMCLVHDLPEARMGDLNAVQKGYVQADENAAVADAARGLPFGEELTALIAEFNAGDTLTAQLARDADHLALVIDLKALADRGYRTPEKWQPHVMEKLRTETAKALARSITCREFDGWWLDDFVHPDTGNDALGGEGSRGQGVKEPSEKLKR
jgi:putative hydrolase of HD superfamily